MFINQLFKIAKILQKLYIMPKNKFALGQEKGFIGDKPKTKKVI